MKSKLKILSTIAIIAIIIALGIIVQQKDIITKIAVEGLQDTLEDRYIDDVRDFVIGRGRAGAGGEGGGTVVAGKPISGEMLQSHEDGIFCKDRDAEIPYEWYEDDNLKGDSTQSTDGTIESSLGDREAAVFMELYMNRRYLEIETNGEEEPHNLSDQSIHTVAGYWSEEEQDMTPAEQYVFSHKDDELVQEEFWDLQDGPSVIPSGGTAEFVSQEAVTYQDVISKIQDPSLNSDGATAAYSFSKQEFLVGPFTLNYTRYYIFGCAESEVAAKEGKGGKIDFAGLIGATASLDGKPLNLSSSNFYFPNGRTAEAAGDTGYIYPYPGETFYLRLPMSEVGDAKSVTSLKFKFQKYIEGEGKITVLNGEFGWANFKRSAEPIICREASTETVTYTCYGGTEKAPCPHGYNTKDADGHEGKYTKIKKCEHGLLDDHIIGWKEWLEISDSGYETTTAQQLVQVGYAAIYKTYKSVTATLGNPGGPGDGPDDGPDDGPGDEPGDEPGIPLRMNYGGTVWEDSFTGKLQEQDGQYNDTEKGVENVKVTIYNKEDNMPYASTYTDKDGRYLFEQIKVGQYYAIFEYDGQIWQPIEYFVGGEENFATNSKAQEKREDRIDFNNKFKEIIEEGAVASDGTITPIEYDTNTLGKPYAITNSGNKELSNAGQFEGANTSNYGGNVEEDYASYKMTAITMDNSNNIVSYPRESDIHIEDWDKQIGEELYVSLYPKIEQINLGLTRRTQADFDVKKDVYKVIVQIDGKTEEYTYSSRQNITESFDVELKHSPEYENLTYNRAIYRSDYNYRISDYNTGRGLTERANGGSAQNIVDAITSAKEGSELRVFVIYKLTFRNASEIYSGTVNELVDYYDEEYSYTGESWYGTPKTTENVVEWTSAPKYGAAKEYPGLDTLYTTTTSNIMLKSGDQEEIYMKFEVKKHTDESGKENSIWLDENSETGEALGGKNNIMEITNYTTYKEGTTIEQKDNPESIEGKIDRDSKPNNTDPNDRATIEDDTDGAPKLNIILNKGEERNIGGIIWEDARNNTLGNGQLTGNGTREDGETRINGAVVQLVEKVEADGNTYEYIWREMETGDSAYSYLDYNGNVQTGSTSGEAGKYFFESYKPGNYIIRVIYGDNNHTIQTAANGGWNNISYNGQDYKSTIYKAVETDGYYDQAANEANPNASKAKDNALRRLNVNAYSHTMSNHIGNVLAAPYNFPNDAELIQELRDNTWMYADTAVIATEVEYNTDTTDNLEDSQKTELVYKIENVGMGLEERPRTNIELVKELDNAVVTLGGGTVMLDVKNGIKEHLQLVPSKYDINEQHKTISPNGYWQYETDKELLQGTQLKLYYKLTVKNTGQIDTVGRTYDLNRIGGISLSEAEAMLGSAYYYGTLDNVRPVTTSVDKIADYVDKYIGYDPEAETNKENNWGELIRDLSELQESGIISKTINITENTTNNKMLITDKLANDEINPAETDNNERSTTLLVSRLLGRDGSTYDYTFNNIAEIIEFTNTVGRRDPDQIPGNADPHIVNKVDPENPDVENVIPNLLELENDTDISENFNIIQPTGENKSTYNYIILASVSAVAILTLGIVLIKKYVVKK